MPRSGKISITVSVTHGQGINHKHSPKGVESFVPIEENDPYSLKFNPYGAVIHHYHSHGFHQRLLKLSAFSTSDKTTAFHFSIQKGF